MHSEPVTGFAVDTTRMHVPASWSGTLDVALDGRRVLSIDPGRHPAQPGGYRIVSWPPQFRPYLIGSTELSISPHGSAQPLVTLEVAFDDGPGRVALVDAAGNPLAADKWGRLSRTFDSLGADFGSSLLDDVHDLLADVEAVLGAPAFIAYGTLLGAVREGGFIGHDTDADISYLSRHTHPSDIALEAFRLRRGLQQRGWRTHRSTTTFLQVWRGEGVEEERRIDIFTSYFLAGTFAMDCWVRGPLKPADVVPLGEVRLAGRALPAPANPEALLEITYGPGWRTPDPAFKFAVPRTTSARAFGFFGHPVVLEAINVDESLRPPAVDEPLRPSDFARWARDEAPADAVIVDVRAGIGHDATWWATQGRRVIAYDVKDNTRGHGTDRPELAARLSFERLAIHDLRRTLSRGTALVLSQARGELGAAAVVLSAGRVLEDLRAPGRANLWILARMLLAGGGQLLVEARAEHEDEVLAAIVTAGGALASRQQLDDETTPRVRLNARWPARG